MVLHNYLKACLEKDKYLTNTYIIIYICVFFRLLLLCLRFNNLLVHVIIVAREKEQTLFGPPLPRNATYTLYVLANNEPNSIVKAAENKNNRL